MSQPVTPTPVDPVDVPVVLLCGGLGTRLREASERLPKPLVDIGGSPILWHVMKTYGAHGFRRFVLCLGYKSELIKNYFLDYRMLTSDFTLRLDGDHEMTFHTDHREEPWEVTFAETGLTTATGTRIKRAAHYLGEAEHFALSYSDGVGSVDLTAGLARHVGSGLVGTVTGVHPTSRFGEMAVDGALVSEFNEKPTRPAGWVNGGYFFFKREFVDGYLSGEPDEMLEHAPLRALARDRQLGVVEHNGFWHGMDTYRDWVELNQLWDRGEAEWKVWSD
ncbi:sugar phosphate nucleotidyltransferase [Nocardioides flavescens]|uniref:sugar phosphate nucleotidyltransferase n=1 Tax=Nocardioides flavescens TaxID=2691959 RepID=UPI0019254A16